MFVENMTMFSKSWRLLRKDNLKLVVVMDLYFVPAPLMSHSKAWSLCCFGLVSQRAATAPFLDLELPSIEIDALCRWRRP
jgi:hypothetical protein